jgi:hypothetical protein
MWSVVIAGAALSACSAGNAESIDASASALSPEPKPQPSTEKSAEAEAANANAVADMEAGDIGKIALAPTAAQPQAEKSQETKEGAQSLFEASAQIEAQVKADPQAKADPQVNANPNDIVSVADGFMLQSGPVALVLSVGEPHVCTEFDVSGSRLPRAPATPGHATLDAHGELVAQEVQPLVGLPDQFWTPGQTLRVKFIGGSEFVRSRVREYANVWTRFANIHFAFVDQGDAEIVTTFEPGGSGSVIGRRAALATEPTMNFGWFNDATSEAEFSRVVLHEFGHALGFAHEHQSPVGGVAWDFQRLYRYYAAMGWDRDMVDSNVVDRYAATRTNYSAYDPQSIMHYPVDPELTLNHVGVGWNTELSYMDRVYAGRWYPFPESTFVTHSILETGDDCDQIATDVEYDVISHERIEFRLRTTHGPFGDWWKGIGLPTLSGDTWLEMQDYSEDDVTVPRDEIDQTRPIRFAKAKFLGRHEVLPFTWDPWRALPGGSRITLTWQRSRCP